MSRRHERPLKRTNPSGEIVFVARYTDRAGKRRSAGTFKRKGACKDPRHDNRGAALCCAQHAIDAAYELEDRAPRRPETVGQYFETWTRNHPRSVRTDRTNEGRVRAVLDVELEGVPLRDWPFAELRRRHAKALVGVMLTDQGRAATGAKNILSALSSMAENAIDDEIVDVNPFKGVKVRANDPRVRKPPRRIRVWSWEQMHAFAGAVGAVRSPKMVLVPADEPDGPDVVVRPSRAGRRLRYREVPSEVDRWRAVYGEAMARVFSDCGLRLGEVLPLERGDLKLGAGRCDESDCRVTGPHLHVRRTAHEGVVLAGTKNDHGEAEAGRVTPLAPGVEALLRAIPPRLDTPLLFPSPRARLWRERNFYRDVWDPAREATGMDCKPHEFRHAWVSQMRASLIDPADLADAAGHTVETATAHYTHGLGRSMDAMRRAVGD